MQDKYVQGIRYKLQKRVRRLNSVQASLFTFHLIPFFVWLDSVPIVRAVCELLGREAPQLAQDHVTKMLSRAGEGYIPETEIEAASMGLFLLRAMAASPNDHNIVIVMNPYHPETGRATDLLREMFLEPLYEYIDEHLDDRQAILYFLGRYKHRCEWFKADATRKLIEEDTQRGEKRLASDLYEYLHDQGIDLYIEPASASGIADMVAEQVGDERVVADAKVFWPERGKGKSYLLSAFNQAYCYARDYHEPFAYLVIFKMCKEDVAFPASEANSIFPCVTINNKTIFFVVVDICDHGASASKRGTMKCHEITATELIQIVEGSGEAVPAVGSE